MKDLKGNYTRQVPSLYVRVYQQNHKKAKLDAAGFIRAEENAKRAQTQELDILCYLLYNVYIINIK